MNIEEFVNSYLQEHRHDVLLNPYNGLIDFANTFKEQMFKDAMETEVWNYSSDEDLRAIPLFGIDKFNNLKDGDKVRIIVIKDESK